MAPRSPLQPVKKGISKPIDYLAPSLLMLHPEIRNTIYDALFHYPYGIRISPATESEEFEFENKTTHRSLASSLSLLLTCRQVYHEAASIFMSSNRWIITRNLADDCIDTGCQVWQAAGAAKWMETLGSRVFMLRSILLDLNMKYSKDCRGRRESPLRSEDDDMDVSFALNLSSLLKRLWSMSEPEIQVTLAYVRLRDKPSCQPHSHTSHCQDGFQPEKLTAVFQTLRKDPLGLRQHGRQFKEIWIQRDCSEGCVYFQGGDLMERHFIILEEGRTVAWLEKTAKPTFASLPAKLQYHIYSFINHPPWYSNRSLSEQITPVSWNLSTNTVDGASPVLLSVSQELRRAFLEAFWQRNWHCITMTTNSVSTDFDKFRKLELFWCTRGSSRHPWDPGNARSRVGRGQYPFEFIFEFQVSPQTRLEDLRINITHFLLVTSSITGGTKLTISISERNVDSYDKCTSSLEQLRAFSLVALSELNKNQPEWMSGMGPAIWMNGLAEIVRVESAYTSCDVHAVIKQYVPYYSCRKRLLDTYTHGINPRSEYDEKKHPRYSETRPDFDGSLQSFLGYLQRVHMEPSPRFWATKYPKNDVERGISSAIPGNIVVEQALL